MKKVIAFGASNSPSSINKKLAVFTANQLKDVVVSILDLNDFELPVYSPALERDSGVPDEAKAFATHIKNCDGIVVSLAEYNGLHTSAFKNLWDWMSRIPMEKPMNIWGNKPMFLLSTSPSKRPTSNVLRVSKELFPHFGANIITDFHLPSFNHFFNKEGVIEPKYKVEFEKKKEHFLAFINQL